MKCESSITFRIPGSTTATNVAAVVLVGLGNGSRIATKVVLLVVITKTLNTEPIVIKLHIDIKGKGKDVHLYSASHVQDTSNAHLRH